LKIALAAPTGKAAARLTESLRAAGKQHEATTIHRLLGTVPDSPYFRHHAERPLTADVVIVDEASMVDLALMAKLFDAVPLTSSLILLGDRNQLSSVEAGNVLADICEAARARESPLHGTVVELERNYRFAETGSIYTLSRAVNAGETDAAAAVLLNGGAEVRWQKSPPAADLSAALRQPIVHGYRSYLEAADPATALRQLQQFRILAAVRHGPFGVENLNSLAEEILADAGLLQPGRGWYRGRPVMITRNDYNLSSSTATAASFCPTRRRRASCARSSCPRKASSAAFCPRVCRSMKPRLRSQCTRARARSSSSSARAAGKDNPVLTRELLYTAITRARSQVELWCNEGIFRAAVQRQTIRTSGLIDALRHVIPGREDVAGT
jgi:exodeoxyribonuclease V alpha subunit